MAKKTKKPPSSTRPVVRKIIFYRCNCGQDPNNLSLRPFDHAAAFGHLDSLDLKSGDRYFISDEDRRVCCWLDRSTPTLRVRIAHVRLSQHPATEHAGDLSDLNLRESEGLAEITHMVFFEGGVVGCEYNHYGPRVGVVEPYLAAKGWPGPPPKFEQLARPDGLESLLKVERISQFRLRVHASELEGESMPALLRDLAGTSGAETVELVLKKGRGRKWLNVTWVKDLAQKICGHVRRPEQAIVPTLAVYGEDAAGEKIPLDLISKKLVFAEGVARLGVNSRRLDPESVYGAIEAARETHADDIRTALTLS